MLQFTKSLRAGAMALGKKTFPKRGLEEFVDKSILEGKPLQTCGRAWSLRELRLKSISDLQKLWIVLMKERNMLLTSRLLANTMGGRMAHPERLVKARKGMARIKQVIAERETEAKQLATVEFEKRKAKNYYSYPPINPLGFESTAVEEASSATPSQ